MGRAAFQRFPRRHADEFRRHQQHQSVGRRDQAERQVTINTTPICTD